MYIRCPRPFSRWPDRCRTGFASLKLRGRRVAAMLVEWSKARQFDADLGFKASPFLNFVWVFVVD